MSKNIVLQNIIAVIWDFDKTLTPGYMQEPLFKHFSVNDAYFWREVNNLPEFYRQRDLDLVSPDTLYLNHILTYTRNGIFPDLSNRLLLELGQHIEFYTGIPDFLSTVTEIVNVEKYLKYEIKVEHYIVSTGLRKMIQGSGISNYVEGIWACEFVSSVAPPGYLADEKFNISLDEISLEAQDKPIIDIGFVIDNTTKTRAIFEINKGTNKIPEIKVNSSIQSENRRIPFENMIYIADGPSDIPVFSVVKNFGGKTYAVYTPGVEKELKQVNDLQKQARIDSYGPADYSPNTQASLWIINAVKEIADGIVERKDSAIKSKVSDVPKHIES
ncbi:haloacid dehalogenase-like hydrolase [bacterium]|nr:haloacid dehalogenase-like hydrolase [bacterium]